MRKMLTLLLVVGFLVGTFAVVEEIYQEYSLQEDGGFSGNEGVEDNLGGLVPCGGGGDGGPSVPG